MATTEYESPRQSGSVTIVDLSGRIDLGEATLILRQTIRDLVESGRTKIILNLSMEVNSMDSAGVGEAGWRLRTGEVQRRRAEVFESHEKEVLSILQLTQLESAYLRSLQTNKRLFAVFPKQSTVVSANVSHGFRSPMWPFAFPPTGSLALERLFGLWLSQQIFRSGQQGTAQSRICFVHSNSGMVENAPICSGGN